DRSLNSLQIDCCEQTSLPLSKQIPRIKLLKRAKIRTLFYRSCLISADSLITRCSILEDSQIELSELYGLDTYKDEVIWSNDQILQSCDRADFDVLYDGPTSVIITDRQNLSLHETHTFMVETENEPLTHQIKELGRTMWYKATTNYTLMNTQTKDNILIMHTGTILKFSELYGLDTYKG
ncbi:Reverse transcriptase domain-containing protein, partial [Aphis craccivora]